MIGICMTKQIKKLTTHGIKIAREGHKIFKEVNDFASKYKQRRLRVGVTTGFARYLSYDLLRKLTSGHNSCPFDVIQISSNQLPKTIAHENLDLILANGEIPIKIQKSEKYEINTIKSSFSVFASDKLSTKLQNKECKAWSKKIPFILPPNKTDISEKINEWFINNGINPEILVKTDDRFLYALFAQNGKAAVIIPSIISNIVCSMHHLDKILEIDSIIDEYFLLVSNNAKEIFPKVKTVIKTFKDYENPKNYPKMDW